MIWIKRNVWNSALEFYHYNNATSFDYHTESVTLKVFNITLVNALAAKGEHWVQVFIFL